MTSPSAGVTFSDGAVTQSVSYRCLLAAQVVIQLLALPDISSDNVIGVQIEINTDGKVISAKLASEKGPAAESLAPLAVAAAWRWRFRPATQNGRPVHSEKTIEFLFRPSN